MATYQNISTRFNLVTQLHLKHHQGPIPGRSVLTSKVEGQVTRILTVVPVDDHDDEKTTFKKLSHHMVMHYVMSETLIQVLRS